MEKLKYKFYKGEAECPASVRAGGAFFYWCAEKLFDSDPDAEVADEVRQQRDAWSRLLGAETSEGMVGALYRTYRHVNGRRASWPGFLLFASGYAGSTKK